MIQFSLATLFGLAALVLMALLVTKLVFQAVEDRLAKFLLLCLLICLIAMILNQLYGATGLFKLIPHYSYTTVVLMFSIGPNLYAYIKRVTRGETPQQQKWWYLHWLLPIGLMLALIPYYFQSGSEKLEFIQTAKATQLTLALYAVNYAQILIYLYFCFRLLKQYQRDLLNRYADIARINLNWLKMVCVGLLVLIGLDALLPMLGILSNDLYNTFLAANSFFIVVIAYSALGQTAIQFTVNKPEISLASDSRQQKYQRSGLRDDSAQFHVDKLNQLMQDEQSYLEDDLSLDDLAEKLGISTHHLSQILNEQIQKNFYDYINEQRILHAKRLLIDNRQLPIVDVAYASGYNNKVSFYNSFKRFVGMTPSKYRTANNQAEYEENALPKR